MIYSRFGTPLIRVIGYKKGWIKGMVKDDRQKTKEREVEWHITELKASNGLQEIMEAIKPFQKPVI